MSYEDIENHKQAIEESTIRRVNWRAFLGIGMRKYVETCLKSGLDKETIIHNLILIAHRNKYKLNMPLPKAIQNVKIGVSSIISELKTYNLIEKEV